MMHTFIVEVAPRRPSFSLMNAKWFADQAEGAAAYGNALHGNGLTGLPMDLTMRHLRSSSNSIFVLRIEIKKREKRCHTGEVKLRIMIMHSERSEHIST